MNCSACGCGTTFNPGSDFAREAAGLCPGCFRVSPWGAFRELKDWKVAQATLRAELAALERDALSASPAERTALREKMGAAKGKLREITAFLQRAKEMNHMPLVAGGDAEVLLHRFTQEYERQIARKPFHDRQDVRGEMRTGDSAALLAILREAERPTTTASVSGVLNAIARIQGIARKQLNMLPLPKATAASGGGE